MLADKKSCTGCGSCAVICQRHCINMHKDEEGFVYPIMENQACVSCGVCEQACPVLMNDALMLSPKTLSFAAQNKNKDICKRSSSGGVFLTVALSILEQGGAVCAAKYSDKFEVVHSIATTREELLNFCGAKYSQSIVWHCFAKIKELLCQGRKILFVGTPCQVAGLKAFLKQPYTNLILMDMICHGVPSPMVWEKYIEERKKQDAEEELSAINLRDKSTGWSNYKYSVRFSYKSGKVYSAFQEKDKFMQGFVANLYLRPSCSQCMFKGIERVSDITLGDYWGVWIQHPEFDNNAGTSLVMIHSDKGQKVWKAVRDEFRVLAISNEEAVQYNLSALQSSPAAEKRTLFFEGIQQGQSISDLVQLSLSNQSGEKLSIIKKVMHKLFRRS